MRRFYSYGPVDSERHFCVERRELREKCFKNLTDDPEKGGHFFTMWAPRQAGKTWLLWQVREEIEKQHKDRFIIGSMSMQGTILDKKNPEDDLLKWIPHLIRDTCRFFKQIRPISLENPIERNQSHIFLRGCIKQPRVSPSPLWGNLKQPFFYQRRHGSVADASHPGQCLGQMKHSLISHMGIDHHHCHLDMFPDLPPYRRIFLRV